MSEQRDPDLLPVPERDFLTRAEAEADDTVDVDERRDTPPILRWRRRRAREREA